jgi:hypothetical protein
LSLDATTIAAISKLNNHNHQSKLADSKYLMKGRNPEGYLIYYLILVG